MQTHGRFFNVEQDSPEGAAGALPLNASAAMVLSRSMRRRNSKLQFRFRQMPST